MRRAAMIGGRSAFRIAIRAAAMTAPPKSLRPTPSMTAAANQTATALTSHATISRPGLSSSFAGCHCTVAPYSGSPSTGARYARSGHPRLISTG